MTALTGLRAPGQGERQASIWFFGAVAAAFNGDGLGVMQQPVQQRGGQDAVVVEDAGPLLVDAVGRNGDAAAFVAVADDLEEDVGAELVDGQIAKLVDTQQLGAEVAVQGALDAAACGGCGGDGVDDVDGAGEEHRVCAQAGGVAQGGEQMGLSEAGRRNEDGVAVLGEPMQLEQVLDLGAVDLGGPVPVELFERLEHGETRVLDAALHAAIGTRGAFGAGEFAQVVQMGPLLFGRGAGDALAVLAHERQVQFGQLPIERIGGAGAACSGAGGISATGSHHRFLAGGRRPTSLVRACPARAGRRGA